MGGFALSIILLFVRWPSHPSDFGEIKLINETELINGALLIHYNKANANYIKSFADYKAAAKSTSTDAEKKLALELEKKWGTALDSIKKINRERQAFNNGNADTSLKYFLHYYDIKRDSLAKQLTFRPWNKDTILLVPIHPIAILDTSSQKMYESTMYLKLKHIKKDLFMDFVSSYPVFGLWTFFTIAQATIWCLLSALFYQNFRTFSDKLDKSVKVKKPFNHIVDFLYTTFFISVFCVFFYWIIIDNWVIDDHFFLNGYNTRMTIYALVGYIFAIFCLAVNFPIIRLLDEVQKLRAAGESDIANALFVQVSELFNFAFFTCAVILSMFILWSSLVINGVNGLEVMRLYHLLAGKSFIAGDYVYLLGLIHSLILLVFFIPTYLLLKNSALEGTKPDADGKQKFPIKELLTGLTSSLGMILVTASPFLTSFVQALLQIFTP